MKGRGGFYPILLSPVFFLSLTFSLVVFSARKLTFARFYLHVKLVSQQVTFFIPVLKLTRAEETDFSVVTDVFFCVLTIFHRTYVYVTLFMRGGHPCTTM